jgi:hypothetical protein
MSDHVTLTWNSSDATVVAAFAGHGPFIASEVLADLIQMDPSLQVTAATTDGDSDEGLAVGLAVTRAG